MRISWIIKEMKGEMLKREHSGIIYNIKMKYGGPKKG